MPEDQTIQLDLLLAILDASRLQIRTTGYTLIRINGVPRDIQSQLVACYSKLEAFDAMITMVIDGLDAHPERRGQSRREITTGKISEV